MRESGRARSTGEGSGRKSITAAGTACGSIWRPWEGLQEKTKHVLEDLNFKGKTVDIRELENYNIEELFEKENMDYKLNVEKIRKEAELQFKELDKVLKK